MGNAHKSRHFRPVFILAFEIIQICQRYSLPAPLRCEEGFPHSDFPKDKLEIKDINTPVISEEYVITALLLELNLVASWKWPSVQKIHLYFWL